jgi:DNA replication factor GINS
LQEKSGGYTVIYNQLYSAWLREIDDPILGALPPDFYSNIAKYIYRINEEDKIPDKKSVKVNLLVRESVNVKRMLKELLDARYRKLVKTITKTQRVPKDLLTVEEARMCETFADFAKVYREFADNLMHGQLTQEKVTNKTPVAIAIRTEVVSTAVPKRSTIRFLKSIPAIMGADMKSYGPFVAEDVASLPPQNAQILVKQGLAVFVEVS